MNTVLKVEFIFKIITVKSLNGRIELRCVINAYALDIKQKPVRKSKFVSNVPRITLVKNAQNQSRSTCAKTVATIMQVGKVNVQK